ncbi:hypothetical protein L2E82_51430 [Cichorium intybus]|nr:hypothetical protein L2E82_51430 [Cichorium intybus]
MEVAGRLAVVGGYECNDREEKREQVGDRRRKEREQRGEGGPETEGEESCRSEIGEEKREISGKLGGRWTGEGGRTGRFGGSACETVNMEDLEVEADRDTLT